MESYEMPAFGAELDRSLDRLIERERAFWSRDHGFRVSLQAAGNGWTRLVVRHLDCPTKFWSLPLDSMDLHVLVAEAAKHWAKCPNSPKKD